MDKTEQSMEEALKDPKTKESVEKLEEAKQEIIDSFPECDKIKKSDIKNLVGELFVFAESYREIFDKVQDYCKKLWPKPKPLTRNNTRNIEYTKWFNYLYDTDDEYPFLYDWLKSFERKFVEIRGQKRTFEEACGIAADWWKIMIFEEINQDNGNNSVGGLFLKGHADTCKRRALANIDITPISLKFRDIMKNYYLGKCQYKYSDSYTGEMIPDVDYSPNSCLVNALMDAGVPKSEVGKICPWKTSIKVDEIDNSVMIRKYQQYEIL